MSEAAAATFTGLVDLLAETLGGKAIVASDDFFASMQNLVKPGRAVYISGKYTDRGKWMDGWESRRRREPGHDFCILELGARGRVLGFDIDTQHFVGNQPAFASVEGLSAPSGTAAEVLLLSSWTELLAPSPLLPDAQNLFAASTSPVVTHLRLNIFPDGGVARFRAFGKVEPTWAKAEHDAATRAHVAADRVDLVALQNGGVALACSDAHFGPMNNLLLPDRAADMGGGWETRRRRAPGHDWVVIQLGARGVPEVVEVDTHHFKGNFPASCSIDLLDAPGARVTDVIASTAWVPALLETRLEADKRHFFRDSLQGVPASHVRLNIFPDGGVSRLRVWGRRDGQR
jgi:allantoicase